MQKQQTTLVWIANAYRKFVEKVSISFWCWYWCGPLIWCANLNGGYFDYASSWKLPQSMAIMYLVNWSIASQLNLIENFNIKPSHSFNAYLIGHPHSATQSHIVMNTLRTPLISSFNIIKNVQYEPCCAASPIIAFNLALIFKPFSKWKFTAFFRYFAFALW